MLKRLAILPAFLTASIALSGCATIKLHPVTDEDIRILKDGEKEWVCMSPEYVKEVMKARLDK